MAGALPLRGGHRLDHDGDPGDGGGRRDGCGRPDPARQRGPQAAHPAAPAVFVSSNASKETVEYCGPRGFIPTYFSKIERAAEFGGAYVDAAAAAGRTYALGQNQALVRWGQIADTVDEARRMVAEYDVDIFRDLYAGTTPMTFDPADPVGSVMNSGLWVVGTPDQVRDDSVRLWNSCLRSTSC